MMEHETSPKIYAAVGRCIYCGTTTGELGREHIIPFGLGGDLILPRASCRSCAKVTGQFERTCLRQMLGATRIRLGLPTRRPKERPTVLPLRIVKTDRAVERRLVPIAEYPDVLTLVAFPPPGILTGAAPSHMVDGGLWTWRDEEAVGRLLEKHGATALQTAIIPAHIFMRMLAKIAHAYAVAVFGIGKFKPLLLELILRGPPVVASQFVGGDLVVPPAEETLHLLGFSYTYGPQTRYLVVSIRLLAMLGTPLYHIAVGEG